MAAHRGRRNFCGASLLGREMAGGCKLNLLCRGMGSSSRSPATIQSMQMYFLGVPRSTSRRISTARITMLPLTLAVSRLERKTSMAYSSS